MRRVLGLFLLVAIAVCTASLVPNVASAAVPGGDRWALLIGIDRFQGKTRPNVGAVGDVMVKREALIRSGWPADHIRVLTDAGAKASDIREGLRWLVDHSTEGGLTALSYSGHVKQVGSTEYLWPHDNAFIPDTEFASYARQLRGRAWINVSGCEAAGFNEGISSPNRLFTASSQANEKSYEFPEAANSVYTWLMVERGLIGGEADGNKDRRVSIQEAHAFAASRAPGMTTGQKHGPQHPYIAGGNGDLFLGVGEGGPGSGGGAAPAAAAPPCFFIFCIFAA